jgi:hypothetical protein
MGELADLPGSRPLGHMARGPIGAYGAAVLDRWRGWSGRFWLLAAVAPVLVGLGVLVEARSEHSGYAALLVLAGLACAVRAFIGLRERFSDAGRST